VDSELKQYLVEMEERTVAYVNERSEQVETKLLTEFHKRASPTEARNRAISTALRVIDLEMEALGERARTLEGRKPQ
jgi:hypothetical protein